MTDYDKLKKLVDEIPILIAENLTASDPKFQVWKAKAIRYLAHKFGEDSIEYRTFANIRFSLRTYAFGTPRSDFVMACQKGLKICQSTFETYLEEMQEDKNDVPTPTKISQSKIFIVHGHDGALKESAARLIEQQGISAIILSEQANSGQTIIEKFESNSDVSAAICLFTADDIGKAQANSDMQPRARQNVVFETGYFMGKLGRDRIAILADKGVEMPSDLSGVVYTDTTSWKVELLNELRAMGYTVDFNRLF